MSALARDLRARGDLPGIVVSPAVGEHAVTVAVPCLERDLAAARAGLGFLERRVRELRDELAAERAAHQRTRELRDELRRRLHDLDPPGAAATDDDW